MEPIQSKVTVSTGGVVINPQGQVLLVNQNSRTWSLPKGHVEAGEDPLETASREIMEESGVGALHFIQMLGVYGRYKIGISGGEDKKEWKVICFFLFKTRQNDLAPRDPSNPQARWVDCDQVENLLTHPKDKAFFKSIRSQIK
ncbi:MAG: NUDIX hydrolase [Candidatus Omnitrophica bacterium]|nr:NUDIX hydrolase [Candidatus Omnitrophota bacterium]